MTIPRRPIDKRRLFRWEGSFEKWSRVWVRKNAWRTRYVLGDDNDALQQCGVIFAYCVNLYADKVDNDAWMMSLFKLAVQTEWMNYSQRDSTRRAAFTPVAGSGGYYESEDGESGLLHVAIQIDHSLGPLAAALASASEELQHVLSIIASAPAEMLDIMFSGAPEKLNQRMRRLCRVSKQCDLVAELKAIL